MTRGNSSRKSLPRENSISSGGFPASRYLRDPGRLFPFDAQLIELIAGALKNKKPMAELLQFAREFLRRSEMLRRNEPILFGEQTFAAESRLRIGVELIHRHD